MTQDMKQNMLGWAKKSEKKVRELWKVLKIFLSISKMKINIEGTEN